MLGKRPAVVIGKLTHPSISGNRAGITGVVATSPRSPLGFKIQSPRGLKSYDVGGVGLGIVAALEKSLDVGCEIQANRALCSRNLKRSNPIPVNSIKNGCSSRRDSGGFEEVGMDSLEEYTLVTYRRPGNESYTKVYYDGGEHGRRAHERREFDRRSSKINRPSVFAISPATFAESTALPASDFLSSCHWCQKKLDGKDIYMYREKAFCSTECRYRQIVMDEHKEKCSTQISRSADISGSPYSNGQIFSPGILAI